MDQSPPPYRSSPSVGAPADRTIHPAMVTVTEQLPGYRIARALGLVLGVAIQYVNYPANFNVADIVEARQRARREALARMIQYAAEMGANAVIGVRHDTANVSETQTEFLAYGTAVWAEVSL